MKHKRSSYIWVFILFLWSCLPVARAFAADVPKMSKEELQAMLGKPDVIVIDVRTGTDWTSGQTKIKGAVREDPQKISSWMDKYSKDKTLILYCS